MRERQAPRRTPRVSLGCIFQISHIFEQCDFNHVILLLQTLACTCARTRTHTPRRKTSQSKALRVHSILLDWSLINFSYYTRCSSAPNHGSGRAFDQDLPSTRHVLFPTWLPDEILPFLQAATLMSSLKPSMATSPVQS